MGSGKKSSKSSPAIIVDDRSSRSPSTSSYYTMSSHGSYSGLATGSNSYAHDSSSSAVTSDKYRSPKSGDFTVDARSRDNVSVYNHRGSAGYEPSAPTPSYSEKERRK